MNHSIDGKGRQLSSNLLGNFILVLYQMKKYSNFCYIFLIFFVGCTTVNSPEIDVKRFSVSDYVHGDGLAVIISNFEHINCRKGYLGRNPPYPHPDTCKFKYDYKEAQKYYESCIKNSFRKIDSKIKFIDSHQFIDTINARRSISMNNNNWFYLFNDAELKSIFKVYNIEYVAVLDVSNKQEYIPQSGSDSFVLVINKHTDIEVTITAHIYNVQQAKFIGAIDITQSGTMNSGMALIFILPVPWIGFDSSEDSICYKFGEEMIKLLVDNQPLSN